MLVVSCLRLALLLRPGAGSGPNNPDRATAAAYGSTAGEPDERTPGPPDRGKRYFRCRVFGGGLKLGDAVNPAVYPPVTG